MEFEFGLKLAKANDEIDLLISKDRVDPDFKTQQTDSMFILTAGLKGYKRSDIKIEIDEDGGKITISSEKLVQKTMMKLEAVKKEVEKKGFRKTFKIPNGVILDKIKARFNEDESRLTIRMPKSVKGVIGIGIEELKDEEFPKVEYESSQLHAKEDASKHKHDGDHGKKEVEEMRPNNSKEEEHVQDFTQNTYDEINNQHKSPRSNEFEPKNKILSKRSENEEFSEEKEQADKFGEENDVPEAELHKRSSIICTPVIVGSSLFVSFIVVVLSFIRSKRESTKKRN